MWLLKQNACDHEEQEGTEERCYMLSLLTQQSNQAACHTADQLRGAIQHFVYIKTEGSDSPILIIFLKVLVWVQVLHLSTVLRFIHRTQDGLRLCCYCAIAFTTPIPIPFRPLGRSVKH